GHGEGLGRVDLHDLRVGVRAADDVEIEHAGQLDVVHVRAPAANEARVFLALERVAHSSDVGRRAGLHQAPPCSAAAACWTALTMFTYPVQRQRLPEIARRMSSSLGFGCFSRKATLVISMPGVQ